MTSVILSELWKKQQGESLISAGERVEKGFVLTKVVSMYSLVEYNLWNFLAFVDTEVFPEGKPQNFSWSYEKLAMTVVNLFNFIWVSGSKISRKTETHSKEQCNVTKFSSIGNGIFISKTTRFFGAWCEKVLYKTSDQSSAAMVSPTGQGGLRNFC